MTSTKSFPRLHQWIDEFRSLRRSIDRAAELILNPVSITPQKAESRIAYITPLWAQCRELDGKLRMEASEEFIKAEPYFCEDYFGELEMKVLDALDVYREKASCDPVPKISTTQSNPLQSGDTSRLIAQMPRISLPRFAGSFAEWQSFRDYFLSLFGSDKPFDNLQRMHYLKSCLIGDAARLVDQLLITSDNFDVAWKLLEARYQNKRKLISTHLENLFTINPVKFESASELRRLLDSVRKTVCALRGLSCTIDPADIFVVYLTVSRLDKSTRHAWEISQGDKDEYPTFEALEKFLNTRIHALESLPTTNIVSTKPHTSSIRTATVRSHQSAASAPKCSFCAKSGHNIYKCKAFVDLEINQRVEEANRLQLCVNCLSQGHATGRCSSERTCRMCSKRHHTMLHRTSNPSGNTASPNSSNRIELPQTATVLSSRTLNRSGRKTLSNPVETSTFHVALATAWVNVFSPDGRVTQVRALLDQGSTHSFVTSDLVHALGLQTHSMSASVCGIGNVAAGRVTKSASLILSSLHDPEASLSTDALVIKSLTSYVPSFSVRIDNWPHLKGVPLADPEPQSTTPTKILIGADLYAYALLPGIRRGVVGQPVGQNTIFGWILSGSVDDTTSLSTVVHSHLAESRETLSESMRRFWEIEEGLERPETVEDKACEEHFVSTHSRLPNGRYVVRVPFRYGHPLPVGESRSRADRVWISIERKLARNEETKTMYADCLRDYLRQGHMIPVDSPSVSTIFPIYLSHHPVMKLSSTTTKLRVVFNASAPTSNRVSLNDLQFVGPKLQTDLPLMIARWRVHAIVCCSDIEQMYRQIRVHEDDCDTQRIRWRESPESSIRSFRLLTVTFGTASAPFLAQRVLRQLASDEGALFPLAASILCKNFYVDDCLFGTNDVRLAQETISQLNQLLKRGGFTLRKWISNRPEVLSAVKSEDLGFPLEKNFQPDESVKILGIKWDPSSDSYRPSVCSPDLTIITKRSVLSTIARLYDPLGWLSPTIVKAKIFMQALWLQQCDWDCNLPDDLKVSWMTYCESLSVLQTISIPRWIHLQSDAIRFELHGFCDASTKAYAAVVYSRVISRSGKTYISLLASKTRVAPLRTQSVPRLELCAALLLSNLISALLSADEFKTPHRCCWTDSSIVLAWLGRVASSYTTFVANRVSQIHSLTEGVSWRHVKSADNPADLSSRGLNPQDLVSASLWWNGPAWLSLDESLWPKSLVPTPNENVLELKIASNVCRIRDDADLSFAVRFSSWTKLGRVTAFMLRWADPKIERVRDSTPTTIEIRRANERLLLSLQKLQFPDDLERLSKRVPLSKTSPLVSLNPFIDESGIIRVGGRLRNAILDIDAKYPIVLRTHHVTRMIVRDAHVRSLHGGVSLTLYNLRDRFWVLQAKKLVRSVIHHCVICARFQTKLSKQLMGVLPTPRVLRSARPFLHCGIDYAGPLQVRIASGRGRKSHPAYIALFVCFAVKAVHIEVVSDYSTPTFLAAFQRFCSRRGLPTDMYSDRGTNFQGADNCLRDAFQKAISCHDFRAHIASDNIEWHFIPPASPHFGGLWESGVRSVKAHLKRILRAQTPTFEELTTLCARIEACLNSRPLAPMTDGLDNLEVLTPSHFLIHDTLKGVPAPSLLNLSLSRLSRWQSFQRKAEEFWKCWSRDYVRSLQSRSKWKFCEAPLREGQIVLLRSDHLPPTKWNLARVIRVHPGEDGIVRVATVRTATTELVRPLVKLALLPVVHDPVSNPDSA